LAQPGQAARVIRIGLVTGDVKRQLLAGARLFALASEHENFGNAVLEALAAGTPVIGTPNIDLISELAESNLAHVAEMNVEAWKVQLARVLDQAAESPDFVRSARSLVADQYSWNRVTQRIVQEYEKLI
jgi:glycosyltransferase involved in cell wall biosynthesis